MEATRSSLLSAIKDVGNQRAWGEFFDLYSGFVRSIAVKFRSGPGPEGKLRPHEVDNVVQQVFVNIVQGKLIYRPAAGSFRSLLTTATKRRCIDEMRQRHPVEERKVHRKAGDNRTTGTLERVTDKRPQHDRAMVQEEWERLVTDVAKRAVKARVSPRQFQIFDAYVLREWEVSKVVETLGVTPNQVYTAKLRVGKIYEEEARAAAARLDNPSIPKPVVADERGKGRRPAATLRGKA